MESMDRGSRAQCYSSSDDKQGRRLHGHGEGHAKRSMSGASQDIRMVLELVLDTKVVAFGVLEAAGSKGRTISIFDSGGRTISVETNGSLKKVQSSLVQYEAIPITHVSALQIWMGCPKPTQAICCLQTIIGTGTYVGNQASAGQTAA